MWAQLRRSTGRNRSKMHFRQFLRQNFTQFIQMISNKSCFQWKFAIFWCSRITSKTPSSLNFKKKKKVIFGETEQLSTGCHLGWCMGTLYFANETPNLKQSQLLFLPSPCQPALPLLLLLTAANLETCNANREQLNSMPWDKCKAECIS